MDKEVTYMTEQGSFGRGTLFRAFRDKRTPTFMKEGKALGTPGWKFDGEGGLVEVDPTPHIESILTNGVTPEPEAALQSGIVVVPRAKS